MYFIGYYLNLITVRGGLGYDSKLNIKPHKHTYSPEEIEIEIEIDIEPT